MTLGGYLVLVCLLAFWVAVAWAMLAAMPKGVCDWRDQLAFAFWPITLFGLACEAIYRLATRRLRTPKVAALDLRPRETMTPHEPPAGFLGGDAAASEPDALENRGG